MLKVLKDLFVAMLNATLILVAVCLILLVMLFTKVNSLTTQFAQNLQIVAPLQESIEETRAEVAGLRSDITALKNSSQDVSSLAMAQLQTRLESVDDRISKMDTSMTKLTQAPTLLVDHAIEQASDKFVDSVAQIRACTPPEVAPSADG